MLIQNITNTKEHKDRGEAPIIIILQSLKTKTEDPEITLAPGQIIDSSMYVPWDDERIGKNPELRLLIQQKRVALLDKYPDPPTKEEQKKIVADNSKKAKEDNILDVKTSDNLTNLQDIVETTKDPDILRAAIIRLQELEGDTIDAPELKEGSNNIIA